jgi:hypothetical protein
VHYVPVPEIVDWYLTDRFPNSQVENPLVRCDSPGGRTNQQANMFLNNFRDGRNALFPQLAGRPRQLRHLPVLIQVPHKAEGFLL